MSLSAAHGRAVHQVRDDLAALAARICGIQRTVPAEGVLWSELAELRADFSVCLATANSAVATLGAMRMTGQAEAVGDLTAAQMELHPMRHGQHEPYPDRKCAAANDHSFSEA